MLVGFGGGAVSATRQTIGVQAPMATAIADVAEARRDYMDESGGRYVQVIADGGMGDSGSFVKALALGADAVMLGARWPAPPRPPARAPTGVLEARHQTLPRATAPRSARSARSNRCCSDRATRRTARPTSSAPSSARWPPPGYVDVKNFQRCGMVVNPYSAR